MILTPSRQYQNGKKVGDAAAYTANQPLEVTPGTEWKYSSGTSNIISRIIRHTIGGTYADYFKFPREALFNKIGMYHTTIEPDASGTFVGSSFTFATARDWTRLGLFYLHDGVWQGERILPAGWVKYSLTPILPSPTGQYGAHWWLNNKDPNNPEDNLWPDLPKDAFAARGFEGQRLLIIPSHNLVIVRLGQSRPETSWDLNNFAAKILQAIT